MPFLPLLMGPLGKILAVLALVAVIFGSGYWKGRSAVQQAWDASIAQQAVAAAASVIGQAENTAAVIVKYVKLKGDTKIVTQTIEKEVIHYVNSRGDTCQLSPEFESTFDRLSGVLDRPPDGVPPTPGAAGGTPESPEATVEDPAVLRAHGDAVAQLRELWQAYSALVEWVRSSYDLSRAGSGRPVILTE